MKYHLFRRVKNDFIIKFYFLLHSIDDSPEVILHIMILADIDECSVSKNGSCSHKCVNTEGNYKRECPDPELIFSTDNKTCHGKH